MAVDVIARNLPTLPLRKQAVRTEKRTGDRAVRRLPRPARSERGASRREPERFHERGPGPPVRGCVANGSDGHVRARESQTYVAVRRGTPSSLGAPWTLVTPTGPPYGSLDLGDASLSRLEGEWSAASPSQGRLDHQSCRVLFLVVLLIVHGTLHPWEFHSRTPPMSAVLVLLRSCSAPQANRYASVTWPSTCSLDVSLGIFGYLAFRNGRADPAP